MNDRQDHLNELVELLRAEPDAVPYVLGYLSAYLPTENLHNAIDSYGRHLAALATIAAARELAAANELIAQE